MCGLNRYINMVKLNTQPENKESNMIVQEYEGLVKSSNVLKNYLEELEHLVNTIGSDLDKTDFKSEAFPKLEGKFQGLCMAMSLLVHSINKEHEGTSNQTKE